MPVPLPLYLMGDSTGAQSDLKSKIVIWCNVTNETHLLQLSNFTFVQTIRNRKEKREENTSTVSVTLITMYGSDSICQTCPGPAKCIRDNKNIDISVLYKKIKTYNNIRHLASR